MSIFQPLHPFTFYKNNGLCIEMQKQVPVFYDDIQVPDVLATITSEPPHQDWSINVMEIMRITGILRTRLPGFSGIQKTQTLEDKLILHSSVV